MDKYIALLRGINVSGQKKIKMADLRERLGKLDLENLKTYIQSGNLVFQHPWATPAELALKIRQRIREEYGFDVPTLVKTEGDFKYILENHPFAEEPGQRKKGVYVTFLYESPAPEQVEVLEAIDSSPEEFVLDGDCLYLYYPRGYGRAKMNNNFFESKLKVPATTRNWRTVNKLYEMASELC